MLKTKLKSIKEKISSNDNLGALDDVKKLIENGESDYFLLVFGGLASFNLSDYSLSKEFYKKAIGRDSSNLNAWQGIFKVYSTNDSDIDDFALKVVEKLQQSENVPSDKKVLYMTSKWHYLLALGKLDELKKEEDAFKDETLCKTVLTKLEKSSDPTAISLMKRAVSYLKSNDLLDSTLHRSVLLNLKLHLPHDEWTCLLLDYIIKFIDESDEKFLQFLMRELLTVVSYGYLSVGKLNDKTLKAIQYITQLNTPAYEIEAKLLAYLSIGNLNDSYLLVESIETMSWPMLGLGLHIYWSLKQYQRFLELVSSDSVPMAHRELLKNQIFEARFEVSDDPAHLEKLVADLDQQTNLTPDKNSTKIYVRALVELKKVDQEQLDEMSKKFSLDAHFQHQVKALLHLNANQLDEAKEQARLAMLMGENDWLDMWLSAKVLTLRGQHQLAMTQLVNAAQKNPYVAEIFGLLGETLFAMNNSEKARSCVERARALKPQNEKFVKILDKILQKLPNNNKLRLEQLTAFLKVRMTSRWALKEAAILELSEDKLDDAIEKIQRLTRISRDPAETSSLWSFLGEAYKRKGRLQSAISALEAMKEVVPGSVTAHLQLAQLYTSMTRYEEAKNELEALKNRDDLSDNQKMYRDTLRAEVGQHLAVQAEAVDEKIAQLAESLFLLKSLQQESDSLLLRKYYAEGLDFLLSFNQENIAKFLIYADTTYGWKFKQSDASDEQIRALAFLIRQHTNSSDCWNELALALIRRYLKFGREVELLNKAETCLKNAISLPGPTIKRASLWCNLGLSYLLQKKAHQAQHCWIRAIQLNRHNDTARGLLGLLYLRIGKVEEALFAIQNAQKLNPSFMEAWCAHALYQEIVEETQETMGLYRHSLVLKPSELALHKYSFYLAKNFQNKIKTNEGTMIDFRNVMRLAVLSNPSDEFLISMAILAEHFGYLKEAHGFVSRILDVDKYSSHVQRIFIKYTQHAKNDITDGSLDSLKRLYNLTLKDLTNLIEKYSPVGELFSALSNNDSKHIREHYTPYFYPLLVTFSILNKKEISQELMEEIEEIRPLHKLFDVYPPNFKKPEELITKAYEDVVVLRDDHMAEKLYELLSIQKTLRTEVLNGMDMKSA